MKKKHTQGEWMLEEDMEGCFIVGTNEKTVCLTSEVEAENGNYKEGEAEANARLIASAPLLLEACKEALNELLDAGFYETDAICFQLTKAINLAEGKE